MDIQTKKKLKKKQTHRVVYRVAAQLKIAAVDQFAQTGRQRQINRRCRSEKSLAVKEIDIGWMRKRGWVREIG